MSRIVSISTVLIVFLVEKHNFCAIEVIQFQSAVLGQEELRELDICHQSKRNSYNVMRDGSSTTLFCRARDLLTIMNNNSVRIRMEKEDSLYKKRKRDESTR